MIIISPLTRGFHCHLHKLSFQRWGMPFLSSLFAIFSLKTLEIEVLFLFQTTLLKVLKEPGKRRDCGNIPWALIIYLTFCISDFIKSLIRIFWCRFCCHYKVEYTESHALYWTCPRSHSCTSPVTWATPPYHHPVLLPLLLTAPVLNSLCYLKNMRKLEDLCSTTVTWGSRFISSNPRNHCRFCPPAARHQSQRETREKLWIGSTKSQYLEGLDDHLGVLALWDKGPWGPDGDFDVYRVI